MELVEISCAPCRGGVPPLTAEKANAFLRETPGWILSDGATRIQREVRFRNFASALEFVNRVGAVAEGEGHHPDIEFGWGYCHVTFQTHKVRGLHENGFIMAAKVNALPEELPTPSGPFLSGCL